MTGSGAIRIRPLFIGWVKLAKESGICVLCGEEFEQKSATRLTCSRGCRRRFMSRNPPIKELKEIRRRATLKEQFKPSPRRGL